MRLAGALRLMDDEPAFTADETLKIAESMMCHPSSTPFGSGTRPTSLTAFRGPAGSGSMPSTSAHRSHSPSDGCGPGRRRRRSSASREVVNHLAEEMRGLVLVTGPPGPARRPPGGHDRPHQPPSGLPRGHDRGPHRGPPHDDTCCHRPAGGRIRHRLVRQRHAGRAAAGPRRHPGRRDAGPGDGFAALTAAETGHLVFSTLHTINATETINRIVDFFPPHQQTQIRVEPGRFPQGDRSASG